MKFLTLIIEIKFTEIDAFVEPKLTIVGFPAFKKLIFFILNNLFEEGAIIETVFPWQVSSLAKLIT